MVWGPGPPEKPRYGIPVTELSRALRQCLSPVPRADEDFEYGFDDEPTPSPQGYGGTPNPQTPGYPDPSSPQVTQPYNPQTPGTPAM